MTLPEVINANRGRPASVTGPGGRIFPVGMGGGPPITTPLAPVSPQLPQIPSFMPGSNPGVGGFSPASYLNPYHPDPHGFNLYGNNGQGQQPLGAGVANGLQTMQNQFSKLPAQPRTYGA